MFKDTGGGIMVTGKESINLYRLTALKYMLKLESIGMKKRGVSAFKTIKAEFNLKGNKQKVLEEFTKIVEAAAANHDNSV
jgi:hypothetical protein